jgi:hypothetical protein
MRLNNAKIARESRKAAPEASADEKYVTTHVDYYQYKKWPTASRG